MGRRSIASEFSTKITERGPFVLTRHERRANGHRVGKVRFRIFRHTRNGSSSVTTKLVHSGVDEQLARERLEELSRELAKVVLMGGVDVRGEA